MSTTPSSGVTVKTVPKGMLICKPTKRDLDLFLKAIVLDCPFPSVLRPEELHVSIFRSKEPMEDLIPEKNNSFEAVIRTAQHWKNPVTGLNSIILLLDSPDLEERNAELDKKYPNFYKLDEVNKYKPHITLVQGVPPHSERNRWWFNNLIDKFSSTVGIWHNVKITLVGEELITDTVKYPAGYKISDYREDAPEIIEPYVSAVTK